MPELLEDAIPFLSFQLEESKDKPGRIVMRGEFARSDKATENKRLYREHLWRREFSRLSEAMENRRMYGELDHPSDGRTKLTRVSHLVTGLRVEGNQVIGTAEPLDTPNGRILKALADAGAQVGVSSRGFGTTRQNAEGMLEVQDDFRLDTFDFVADPATKTAYPQIFKEERQILEQAERELTPDLMNESYHGLVDVLAEAVSNHQEAKRQGQEGLTEDSRQSIAVSGADVQKALREGLDGLREEAIAQAKIELAGDPEVVGASQVLEQIVSLVAPFGGGNQVKAELESREARIAELEAKLEAKSQEVEEATKAAEAAKQLAVEAAFGLHLERAVANDPAREAIIALVGDVAQFESRAKLDERVKVVRNELERRAGPERREEPVGAEVPPPDAQGNAGAAAHEEIGILRARVEDLEKQLDRSERGRATATERADNAEQEARKALAVAESFEIRLRVEERARGLSVEDQKRVRVLCEGVESLDDVDRRLGDFRMRGAAGSAQQESDVTRIRTRVGRGVTANLTEGRENLAPAGGPSGAVSELAELGVDVSSIQRLSGAGG